MFKYIEEVFLEFSHHVFAGTLASITTKDLTATVDFANIIKSNNNLTERQGRYILRILSKYKTTMALNGFDYREFLDSLQWQRPFRTVDNSKKIYVECGPDKRIWICIKFPYSLKFEFNKTLVIEHEIRWDSASLPIWDSVKKIKKINLNSVNIIALCEFVRKHRFEIDSTFEELVSNIEEIWNQQSQILPAAVVDGHSVNLLNAPSDAVEFWNRNRTGKLDQDAFLARVMGYNMEPYDNGIVSKICSSPYSAVFWTNKNAKFFELYTNSFGKTCIILSQGTDVYKWLTGFLLDANEAGINRSDINVFFRVKNNPEFNTLVKEQHVVGKPDNWKLGIFLEKPPKWLFKDENTVTIVATDNLYPPSSILVRNWFNSQPCLVYLGEVRPAVLKVQTIVDL